MTIGFGWDDNDQDKYEYWMEFERIFRQLYTPEEIAKGIPFSVEPTKYEEMKKWTKELKKAIRKSRDEELDKLVMKMWMGEK